MNTTHKKSIAELAELGVGGLVFTYNTDGADVAELSMKPEAYARLEWQVGHRVELYEGDTKVFSGVLATGQQHSVAGGQGETVGVTLVSDFYQLEHTVYARQTPSGEVIFPGIVGEFAELGAFAHNVYNWASGWSGSKLESGFECRLSGRIPTPQSNGTNSCAQLLQDALQWTPNAVMVQRYGEQDRLIFTTPWEFEALELTSADPVTSINLQARHDLCPPVCALVGGAHLVLPEGGDVRELGAFVYAVPLRKERVGGPAGSAPASQKMVVRGVPIPNRYQFRRGVEEFRTSAVVAGSDTEKFLKQFFPQYGDFLRDVGVGACVVSVVPEDELNAGEEAGADEDAQPTPANYSAPDTWSEGAGAGKGGIYVLTEGSFNASSNSKKNIKGLRWCKASLTLSVAIRKADVQEKELAAVLELFPGRRVNDEGETVYYANLVLDAVLINRRKKIYDPATNTLCRTDAEWTQEDDTEPSVTDYVEAMRAYYAASREVFTEGSIGLLHEGKYAPHELTGRMVTLSGFRTEWASMQAVVRSVTWDYMRRKIELQVGPRAVLGFGELLERRMMAKMTGENEARRQAVPFDALDEETQAEKEADMSVSPSISAGLGAHTTGNWRKPWTLYPVPVSEKEDGTIEYELWLQGGTLARGRKSWNVPNTKHYIVAGKEDSTRVWDSAKGNPKVRFYRDAQSFLTFDIYQ